MVETGKVFACIVRSNSSAQNGYKNIYTGVNKAPDMVLGHPDYSFPATYKAINPERYGAEFNLYDENNWVSTDPPNTGGIVQHINAMASDGAYFVGYDLEQPNTPASELNNQVSTLTAAHNLASSKGMKLWCAPGSGADSLTQFTNNAPHIDICIIQGEGKRQLTPAQQQAQNPGGANIFTATTGYRDYVNSRAAKIRAANSSCIILAELSTSPGGLTTDLDGMQQAWNSVSANVDGATCWPGASSGGDQLLKSFLQWYGTTDQRFSGAGGGGTKIIQSLKTMVGLMRSSTEPPLTAYVDIYRPFLKTASDFTVLHPNYTFPQYLTQMQCERGAEFNAYNTANYSPSQTVPDIVGNAATMGTDGCVILGYALNATNSPSTENSSRSTYVTNAANSAHNNGMRLMFAPGAIDIAGVDALAPLLSNNDIFVVIDDNDIPDGTVGHTDVSTYVNFVKSIADEIAIKNTGVVILAQLSTIPNAGTTTLDVLQRAWKGVYDHVDGAVLWSNNATTPGDPLLRRFTSWFCRCASGRNTGGAL